MIRVDSSSPQDIVQLAIETTGRLGSVAVLRGQRVIRQTNLDPKTRTAATLAPEVDRQLRWCRESQNWPSLVSVADGPGSFTGLRIGVTTAKTLCYALDLPLVSVDSLAAISAAAMLEHSQAQKVWVCLDAYRGQVFAGKFDRSWLLPDIHAIPGDWTAHPAAVDVISLKAWCQWRTEKPADVLLAGDEKPLRSTEGIDSISAENDVLGRTCDAVGVGMLGLRAAMMNQSIDPLSLVPRYLKVSAAEEKLAGEG